MWRKRDEELAQPQIPELEDTREVTPLAITSLEVTSVDEPAPPADNQPRELMLLGEAKRILMQATSLDEIKDIRDKAEAARKYIASAQLGLAMQNHAAEVKLRAERRAGELLSRMQLVGGDRRSQRPSDGTTLNDLGITKHQSSRWQREAAVPEQAFEHLLRETRDSQQELTTVALLRLARQFAPQ